MGSAHECNCEHLVGLGASCGRGGVLYVGVDGAEVHSFQTLLSGIARNTCRVPGSGPGAPAFEVITIPNAKQQRA